MNHLPTINVHQFSGDMWVFKEGRWTHRTFSSAVSGPSHGSSFEVSTLFESNGSYVHPFYGPNQCNGDRGFNGVSFWGVWNNTEHSKIEDCPRRTTKNVFLKGKKRWFKTMAEKTTPFRYESWVEDAIWDPRKLYHWKLLKSLLSMLQLGLPKWVAPLLACTTPWGSTCAAQQFGDVLTKIKEIDMKQLGNLKQTFHEYIHIIS